MESIIKVKGYKRDVEMNLIQKKYNFLDTKELLLNKNESNQKLFITPSLITNAIINLNINTFFDEKNKIFENLESLLCKHLVIQFDEKMTISNFQSLIESINQYNIHECLIISEYSEDMYTDEFADIALSSNRYNAIIFYNSPFKKNLENLIFYVKEINVISEKKQNEFVPNFNLYLESLNHNSYFNRKLYIGPNGEIKNAPESEEIFGYIQKLKEKNSFTNIIESAKFQKFWNINKDLIDVCRECEFRYMCVDNRTPLQREDGGWYHEEECNYNPFIGKWRGEEGYASITECGVTSNKNEFYINHNMIEIINEIAKFN